ncbi:SGNH/GDSL hydrolase family protein [Pseudalkalibacillus sp. Hm43]|uniref:SGNH/GDSL hydrolase family protein n=1 Tax=Pseudalkalibacillus sp. Hm43 TaxID=3450742 RepID=UPI003F42E629
MKKLLYIFVVVLSISAVIFGHLHWQSKLASKVEAAKDNVIDSDRGTERDKEKAPAQKETNTATDSTQTIEQLTSNLPSSLQERIMSAKENNEKVKFAIIGSGELTTDNGWTGQFVNGMKQAYGEELFDIVAIGFGDTSSTEIHSSEKYIKISQSQPDIALIEPFILNDNKGINIDDSMDSIKIMERRLKDENPEVSIFLQPPHPIYQPGHYMTQINSVKELADETEMIYLNHWDAWPDVQDEEINNFVNGVSGPKEEGNTLWAEYLINYFTGK